MRKRVRRGFNSRQIHVRATINMSWQERTRMRLLLFKIAFRDFWRRISFTSPGALVTYRKD